jgi:hypothetical protein
MREVKNLKNGRNTFPFPRVRERRKLNKIRHFRGAGLKAGMYGDIYIPVGYIYLHDGWGRG